MTITSLQPPSPDTSPLCLLVAGTKGAGKSTVIEQLATDPGFPTVQLGGDLANDELQARVLRSIALQECFMIETPFDTPLVLALMQRAKERRYRVELIVVGAQYDLIVAERVSRKRLSRIELQTHQNLVSAAVDAAAWSIMVDNSTAEPFIAAEVKDGVVIAGARKSSWVQSTILDVRTERDRSRADMLAVFERSKLVTQVQPLLQVANPFAGKDFSGEIVAVTNFHALQRTGLAMHVLHDLAVMPATGMPLSPGTVASISYQALTGGERDHEHQHDRSPER